MNQPNDPVPTDSFSSSTQEMTDSLNDQLFDLNLIFGDSFDNISLPDNSLDLSSIPLDDLLVSDEFETNRNNSSNSSSEPPFVMFDCALSDSRNETKDVTPTSLTSLDTFESSLESKESEIMQFTCMLKQPLIRKSTRPYRRLKSKPKNQCRTSLSNLNNEDLDHGQPGQKLYLSDEEKYLLMRDNIKIPTKLPLTRIEDRALRAVRRRIRNKLSAKASRAKKQEHVIDLEKRVALYEEQNGKLSKKVDELNQTNRGLVSVVRRLQEKISDLTGIGSVASRFSARKSSQSSNFKCKDKTPIIGRHQLTSRDTAQKAYLPQWKDDLQPNGNTNLNIRSNGTYLFMVALVFLIALFPVAPSITSFSISPSKTYSGAVTSRVLLAYGPQTLDDSIKDNDTITIDEKHVRNIVYDSQFAGNKTDQIAIAINPEPDRRFGDQAIEA